MFSRLVKSIEMSLPFKFIGSLLRDHNLWSKFANCQRTNFDAKVAKFQWTLSWHHKESVDQTRPLCVSSFCVAKRELCSLLWCDLVCKSWNDHRSSRSFFLNELNLSLTKSSDYVDSSSKRWPLGSRDVNMSATRGLWHPSRLTRSSCFEGQCSPLCKCI